MHRPTLCAIVGAVTACCALAGTAHAQISGTIGGDVVACDPLHVFGVPFADGIERHGGVFAHCPGRAVDVR